MASLRLVTGRSLQPRLRWLPLAALVALASSCGSDPAPTPQPPAITCPQNISVSGVTGGSRTLTYTTPVASGGAQPVATTCTPASGTAFPTGTTTVGCTATDAQNRQASCSFTVQLSALLIDVHRFLAFGDSVTAGEDGRRARLRVGFIDPITAYPAVLQSRLTTDFPSQDVAVVNAGRSGERVRDDVPLRLPGQLQTHQPDVLLLIHGYNDLLNDGTRAVDVVVSALRDAVRMARGRGVRRVYLATLTPGRTPTGQFRRMIDPQAILQVNARLPAMAAAEGATLVDAFAAFTGREAELVHDDGLHLTVAGNRVLAETFYGSIRRE